MVFKAFPKELFICLTPSLPCVLVCVQICSSCGVWGLPLKFWVLFSQHYCTHFRWVFGKVSVDVFRIFIKFLYYQFTEFLSLYGWRDCLWHAQLEHGPHPYLATLFILWVYVWGFGAFCVFFRTLSGFTVHIHTISSSGIGFVSWLELAFCSFETHWALVHFGVS